MTVEATLVNEVEGEVFEAQRVGFFERKWKSFALSTFNMPLVGDIGCIGFIPTNERCNWYSERWISDATACSNTFTINATII